MRVSTHFLEREFACSHCGRCRIDPHLVEHLEQLRALVGRPLHVVSGYRCPEHNRAVGGAKHSQHLTGRAVDLVYAYATVEQAKRAGFTGIGRRGTWATHVDVRAIPATWSY